MSEFKQKNVLVVGLGLSGKAAAQFLLKRGASVWGVDRNPNLVKKDKDILQLVQQGLIVCSEPQPLDLQRFDSVVVSPGIPPTNFYYAAALASGVEIMGEVELACRFIKQPLLAITGTNGKTTTTLLVAHVLNQSGKPARALGNVGVPLTSELDDNAKLENSILVVELSSFQLETLRANVIDAGVILNITPDHLDRYENMRAYAAAKIQMQKCMKPRGKLYLFEPTYRAYRDLFKGDKPLTYGYERDSDIYNDFAQIFYKKNKAYDLPLEYQGRENHDAENCMAAYALCKEMGVSTEQFVRALKTFKKPPHRLEFVRTINEVSYFDDSKGTNIDAVIRAVSTLKGEIILIAGGVDKGSAYTPWIEGFCGHVKQIFAIGEAAHKIKNDLAHHLPVEICLTLESAIKEATSLAKSGQSILLSPGCSSFDMFRDYAHRGNEFKSIVNALEFT